MMSSRLLCLLLWSVLSVNSFIDGPLRGDDAPVKKFVNNNNIDTIPRVAHDSSCSGENSSLKNCSVSTKTTDLFSLPVYLPTEPEEVKMIEWDEIYHDVQNFSHNRCSSNGLCQRRYPFNHSLHHSNPNQETWNTSQVIGPNLMNDMMFQKSPCHCDKQCVRYGDCCPDAARLWWGSRAEQESRYWQCLPLKSNRPNTMISMYMIGKCPYGSEDEHLSSLCHRRNSMDYSYLQDVPVLSLKTNITYANIFCARCHNDYQQLADWTLKLDFSTNISKYNLTLQQFLDDAQYDIGERRWTKTITTQNSTITIECNIIIQEFENALNYIELYNGRRCIPVISSCAKHWHNRAEQQKCDMYTLFAIGTESSSGKEKIYKNPHCARCNDVDWNRTNCYSVSNRVRAYGKFHFVPFEAFSLVLDFSFAEMGRVGQIRKCPESYIWDYLHQKCHAVVCGSSYENINGVCRKKTSPDVSHKWNSTILDSSCERIVLNSDDYWKLTNGTLYINKTNEFYNQSQYEEVNGSLQICRLAEDYYFKYSRSQSYLSGICFMISIICLFIHIVIHILLPKLRNLPGKNLLSLSCSLFAAQILFLTCIHQTSIRGLCVFLGIINHWFYLSSFFWMNIMGLDICRTFTGQAHRPDRSHLTFRYYSLYAWGCPTAIVVAGLILDWTSLSPEYAPHYGQHLCWISNKKGLALFFMTPVSLIVVGNLLLFSLTVRGILQQRNAAKYAVDTNQTYRNGKKKLEKTDQQLVRRTRGSRHQKHKVRFILYIKLAVIMGLGWIFGFLAALAQVPGLWYPFILFNGLQGMFIFIAFDMKKKIYYMIWELFMKKPYPSSRRVDSKQASTSFSGARTSSTLVETDGVEIRDRNSQIVRERNSRQRLTNSSVTHMNSRTERPKWGKRSNRYYVEAEWRNRRYPHSNSYRSAGRNPGIAMTTAYLNGSQHLRRSVICSSQRHRYIH